jgi:hypothetical protein
MTRRYASIPAALLYSVLALFDAGAAQDPPSRPEVGTLTPWDLQAAVAAAQNKTPTPPCELRQSGYVFAKHLGTVLTPSWRVEAAVRSARRSGKHAEPAAIPPSAAQKLVWILARHREVFADDGGESDGWKVPASDVIIRPRRTSDRSAATHPIWTMRIYSAKQAAALERTYGLRITLPLLIAAFQPWAFDSRNEIVVRYEGDGTRSHRARVPDRCLQSIGGDR